MGKVNRIFIKSTVSFYLLILLLVWKKKKNINKRNVVAAVP